MVSVFLSALGLPCPTVGALAGEVPHHFIKAKFSFDNLVHYVVDPGPTPTLSFQTHPVSNKTYSL